MTEAKRVPTESEAKLLLQDVARTMEDEAAIDEAALHAGRTDIVAGAAFVLVLAVGGVLWFQRNEVSSGVAVTLLLLAAMTARQSVEIAGLRRAARALARTAKRARRKEPLPRAPSPPTAATG